MTALNPAAATTELRAPWQYTADALPPVLDPEEKWFCQESSQVLIRTTEGCIHLAHYRIYVEDGQPDPDMTPEWVLEGRDGYSLPLEKVDAWAPTPRWD